ncbi:MAG TPA: LysR substrate-binding domain-containing protein [Trebonia sp.]|nr:LysR substrate-binding domain-containing protein [Trebonia sp.]
MDVDLRKLRYFAAVARQRNFSRAAAELHIAQPVLSRQIRALESELGAVLFIRDRNGAQLTPAGTQLALDAEPLLAEAEALRRRVTQVARKARQFTVAFMPGLIVTEPVRAFGDAHPELSVEVLRTSREDQAAVLHDGRADVSYVRLPVDRHGLQLRTLLREPNVAVLPAGHRLAGKETISLADLADEHLLQHPDIVPEWRAVAAEWRGRSHVPPLRITHAVEKKLERVAAGRGIVVLPESTASYYQRPGVFHLRISDIPLAETCLAWPSSRPSPLIEEFATLAAAHRPATGA